jgi:hypothetical protein
MPTRVKDIIVQPTDPALFPQARIAFSALPADLALHKEPAFAQAGFAVCSNASAFRREEDVPILLPEVNPEHLGLIPRQRQERGWTGCIVTNPNCTSTGLTVALKALQEAFGLRRVFAVSMQALSGAGYPGVASLDILDNVIPWIGGEEEKVEWEPRKMLGKLQQAGSTLPHGSSLPHGSTLLHGSTLPHRLRIGFVLPTLRRRAGWRTFILSLISSLAGSVEPYLFVAREDAGEAAEFFRAEFFRDGTSHNRLFPGKNIFVLPVTQEAWLSSPRGFSRLMKCYFELTRMKLPEIDLVHSLEAYPTGLVSHWLARQISSRPLLS